MICFTPAESVALKRLGAYLLTEPGRAWLDGRIADHIRVLRRRRDNVVQALRDRFSQRGPLEAELRQLDDELAIAEAI